MVVKKGRFRPRFLEQKKVALLPGKGGGIGGGILRSERRVEWSSPERGVTCGYLNAAVGQKRKGAHS